MIIMVQTTPLANKPIVLYNSMSDSSMGVKLLSASAGRDLEVDRDVDQHAHRPPVHARRTEQGLDNVVLGRLIEPGVRALKDFHGVELGPTGCVDDRLNHYATLDSSLPQHFRIHELRPREHRGLLLDDRFHEQFVA